MATPPAHRARPSVRNLCAPLCRALCALLACAAVELGAQTYDAAVARWVAQDALAPEPAGAIVFAGSSSIRRWERLRRDFADYPVIQRGIGGSLIEDMIRHHNQIILPYQPRALVLWSGTNNINNGQSGEHVFAKLQELVGLLRAARPELPIFYLGITKTPATAGDPVKTANRLQANALISAWMADRSATGADPHLHYVDLPALFESLAMSGSNLGPYYLDTLHLNQAGYDLWSPVIRAALNSAGLPADRAPFANPGAPAPGKRIYFDFGPSDTTNGNRTLSPDANGNHWNNWYYGTTIAGDATINPGETVAGLVDHTGAATGVRLVITGNFIPNGIRNGGLTSPGPALGTLAVATATQDFFYSTSDGAAGGGNDDTGGGFLLSGLDPSRRYDFRFLGSRAGASPDTRTTTYVVSGSNSASASLITTGPTNTSQTAQVTGLKPNAHGEIFVDLVATPATNTFAYINAMEVTVVSAYDDWARRIGLTPGVNAGPEDTAVPGGAPNLAHFAFGTSPLSATGSSWTPRAELVQGPAGSHLSLLIPVRRGAVFTSTAPATATVDGIVYQVFGDDNLSGADLDVVEAEPGDVSPLPALPDNDGDGQPDHHYRRFRTTTSTGEAPRSFMSIKITVQP